MSHGWSAPHLDGSQEGSPPYPCSPGSWEGREGKGMGGGGEGREGRSGGRGKSGGRVGEGGEEERADWETQ